MGSDKLTHADRLRGAPEGAGEVEAAIRAAFRHGYGKGGDDEARGVWRVNQRAEEYIESNPGPLRRLRTGGEGRDDG